MNISTKLENFPIRESRTTGQITLTRASPRGKSRTRTRSNLPKLGVFPPRVGPNTPTKFERPPTPRTRSSALRSLETPSGRDLVVFPHFSRRLFQANTTLPKRTQGLLGCGVNVVGVPPPRPTSMHTVSLFPLHVHERATEGRSTGFCSGNPRSSPVL